MKNIKYYIHTILIAFGLLSCEGFLEEDPGTLTTQADLSSPEAARAFVTSIYANLNVVVTGSGGWGGNTLSLLEFMSGKADGVPQTEAFRFNQLTYDSQSFYIDTYWNSLYQGILRCNVALEQVPRFTVLSAQEITDYLAEIRTMRAFYYFYLVRMYGDVPMISEPVRALAEVNRPRTAVKTIYDEIIIPDLLAAENSNLAWRRTNGEVSMGFIKSLLADVYLTYAGHPVMGGADAYAQAASRALEVLDQKGTVFNMFPEYRDMINPENKNSGEFIFQVQFDKINRTNPLTPVCLPTFAGISAYSNEFGGLVPRQEFLESYEPGDKRIQEKQYFISEYNGQALGGRYIYKWFDKTAVDEDARSELNFSVYRLPDVMLMYAEASNRAEGGPNATALAAVNEIRERATLDPIGAMDSNAFEEEVWNQRYFELCFEGKVWFDMLRTRKVKNDLTGNYDDFVGHTNVFNSTFAERNLLFPIPLREMDVNQELVQNPGF